jgi:glutamate-1-semialdehyde 2,1-aminomutase
MTQKFFIGCIEHGLYFHTDFTVSAAHDEQTLAEALERFESVVKQM